MRLRAKKRLLQMTSLALVAVGGGVLALAWTAAPPEAELDSVAAPAMRAATDHGGETPLAANSSAWQRTLRRPLYDPPPPVVEKVVKQVRPITVKVVGTVVEGDNSQAFVKQSNGRVEIKRIGDHVTGDPQDGVIASIAASEVVIEREDGQHQLPVGERN